MKAPVKYFQICTPGVDGVLRPLEINQYGETDSFFATEDEVEKFIHEHFWDAQDDERPDDKTDIVLVILPLYLCRFKKR